MRRTLSAVCLLALASSVAAALGCNVLKRDEARTRAENILNGMKHGYLDGEWQTAVCMWYDGVVSLADQRELEEATDGFERWLRDAGIQTPIAGYEIVEVTISKGTPPAALVSVRIDGAPHRMRIVKHETVSWADEGP
jgi:hypothetical protein